MASTKASTTERKITLLSDNGMTFSVSEAVALQSKTIKQMIENGFGNKVIPLRSVEAKVLAKVIEYCEQHVKNVERPVNAEALGTWYDEFLNIDEDTLFDLVHAAKYLDIEDLYHLTTEIVSKMIKMQTLEDIQKTIIMNNGFTPEEEEQILKDNQWVYDIIDSP